MHFADLVQVAGQVAATPARAVEELEGLLETPPPARSPGWVDAVAAAAVTG